MTDPIRSALKRLLSAVLDGLGQDDHPMGWARVDDAIDAARAALAAEPVGEGPTGDAAVEAAAELIYNQAMKWAATQPIPSDHINIPAWQQGGNSDAQEVARRTARAALAAKPLVKGPTDEELLELWQGWNLGWDPQKGMVLMPHPAEYARAVLARYGHQPAPPAEGEVAELVTWLRNMAEAGLGGLDELNASRAADLLERQAAPEPVAVSERLPEPSVKVLAHYFNDLGKGRTICAIWVPAKTRSDSYGDDDFTEYDEESDTFYWPEGWYETIENWDDLGYVKVDEGEVIYWQPLPKWPVHALPLPQGEVE